MEAVVHLDRPSVMPSQSQMSFSRTSALHGRPNQGQSSDPCYKGSSPGVPGSGTSSVSVISATVSGSTQRHSPATYSGSSSYSQMRYIHPTSYVPPVGATPIPYRDSAFSSARSSNIIGERSQNLEYMREGIPSQSKPRISMLTNPDFMSLSRARLHPNDSYRDSIAPPSISAFDVNTPVKKIRLGDNKSDHQRTLRIDTRVPSMKQEDSQQVAAYTPQVEAISPTLPTEALQDEAIFRSTKDELLLGIAKVDREITKTEVQIAKLKRKQQELEEAAKKPATETEEEEVTQPKHQSPAQKIYAENRRKAQEAHQLLKNLGPTVHLPLYNQPSDTSVYHENKRRHLLFKERLMLYLRKKHGIRELREKRLTTAYSTMVQHWLRKVEKVENYQKRKAREAKNREFFEKIFPKLRKQREDRERFNRVGSRVKSEADLEEIMDGLQEQEMEDKKMRSYAVVPPLLLDAKQRSVFYINNNGRIDDFPAEYKERQLLNVWTQAEKDIFKEKYLQHPKNFGMIASYLEKKSACDCVQYYYLSKKTEHYKRLLRISRRRQRAGRNPLGKVSGSSVTNNADALSTAPGVTTRLQSEQLQKQEPLQVVNPSDPPTITDAVVDAPSSFLIDESQCQPPPLLLPHAEKKMDDVAKGESKAGKDKKEEDEDSSDEDKAGIEGQSTAMAVACAVCKTESSSSRALPKSQASQYGLIEDDVAPDARVCNLCRCKAVRSRFTNCPIPSCVNSKGQRVKRLRSFPSKWQDLPLHIKDQISFEFEVNESITKCCSACYNRIIRRMGVLGGEISGSCEPRLSPSMCSITDWTYEEIVNLREGIKNHGVRWNEVAQEVGSNKTSTQCMNFFYKYMKRLSLDRYLPLDTKQAILQERKPVLTDEEESGSSTSSCYEMGGGLAGPGADSDTASAPSPLHNPDESKETSTTPPPQLIEEGRITLTNPGTPGGSGSSPHGKSSNSSSLMPPVLHPNKEDYDSSATETADEGQGGGEADMSSTHVSTPKREEEVSSPITVKDLMLNVIEMQLMKNPGDRQSSNNPGAAPTISSILKSEHSISYSQRERNARSGDNNSLATVSVVSPLHGHQTIQDLPKDGLLVVQVQPTSREPEGVTLDLSIKKNRDNNPSQLAKALPHQSSTQSSHGVYRPAQQPVQLPPSSQPQGSQSQLQHQVPQSLIQQTPQSLHSQNPNEQSGYFHQQILPPPMGSSKLSPGVISGGSSSGTISKAQCGSIIHGTPVSSPNIYNQPTRFEPSQPPYLHTSPHKESGSITQGTPVHQRSSLYQANSEYYGKRIPTSGYYPPRTSQFNVEQRQIIMNDYITSQQMHGHAPSSSAGSRNGKVYYQPSRQGVIQRHNTKPPSPGVSHHPPGYEAFSSLVDVASRQPSLPVPSPISVPMQELKQNQDDKRHLHEGLGERFNRESPQERFASREGESRYVKENSGKVHVQPPERREQQHQSLFQLRDPLSHLRGELQQQQHQISHQIREQHRERELTSQPAPKIRDHHVHVQQSAQPVQQPPPPSQQQASQQSQPSQHSSSQSNQSSQSSSIQQQPHHHQQTSLSSQQPGPPQQRDLDMRVARANIQNYSPRIIHESHHPVDQRLIQVPPGFREQPPSSQPSSIPHAVSRSLKQEQGSSEPQTGRGREGSTLTAASLIDAIITHQINQSSDTQAAPVPSGNQSSSQTQHTRPGDRLFQSFHRECTESNGKLSPMKTSSNIESKSPHGASLQIQSQPQVMTNEPVEVYNNPNQGMRSTMFQGYDHQTWKLRRALQQKDVDAPPVGEKSEEHIVRNYYSEPPVPLSPLDYVKNRIAEVMRTSEDEGVGNKGGESPVSPDVDRDEIDPPQAVSSTSYMSQSHTYTYPFSALSLTAGGTAAGVPITSQTLTSKPGPETVPEPAPLLSAQYEPLSDED